jgi:hypothetical protein
MVFDATFNNISAISWRSVLSVEEIGVTGENHRPMGKDIGYKGKISNIYQTMHNKAAGFTTTYAISAYHP